ncbi:MAG: hypothetical protein M3R27_05895 [Bacteroidota bacterium]|nr:hypothetical protein [Bacteroidota bacterium]
MAKTFKAEQVKVRQIQEWLLQGHIVTDVCRNIIASWEISEHNAIKYIAAAFEDFSKQVNKGYEETRAYHIQMRLSLYKKAVEANDYKTAMQILVDLGKLEDIY